MKQIIASLLLFTLCAAAVQAREVFPLNEGWRFFFKSENSSDNARHVTLPHSWNTDPAAEGSFLETTGNYQNDLLIPAEWASKRLFVKFYGVQSVADVFVNGNHVGQHRGGASAFTFEITDKVRFGSDNTLLVIASNGSRSDILPTSTDINLYGGIYRGVALLITDRTAVSPLWLGTDGILVHTSSANASKAAGQVEVHLTTKGESTCALTLDITAPDGEKVFSKHQKVKLDGKAVRVPFEIENPRLWSPDTPALYTVTASIGEETITDRVSIRTGFRTIDVSTTGGLRINGRRETVHGITLHHDNALAGGTLSDRDYEADLRQIRDMGATALRSAVMPHAQYLYDRCDEQGLLAWIDIPFHRAFLSDMGYYSTPQFEQNGLQQLQEIIAQNINHPSVVMWGLFAHLWSRGDDVTPYLRKLNDTAHAMDPSRPTVACSDQDGSINFITDLIVWHQELGWKKGSADDITVWRDQLQKNWSHLRSGVCYGAPGIIGHQNHTAQAGARINWMPESRQTRFHEEYARNLQSDSLFWGVWVNNMFDYGSARRPYGINSDGLVTLNRHDRKDAYWLYRALWNKQSPTLHIADKRHAVRTRERQAFRVYSSAGTPRLVIGADTLVMREYAACQYRSDSVELKEQVVVKVSAGALQDSVNILTSNVLKPKRSLDPRRITNLQSTN